MEAVRFYDRFGKTVTAKKSIPTIVQELLSNLKADGKSEYHRRDMKRRLEAFAVDVYKRQEHRLSDGQDGALVTRAGLRRDLQLQSRR